MDPLKQLLTRGLAAVITASLWLAAGPAQAEIGSAGVYSQGPQLGLLVGDLPFQRLERQGLEYGVAVRGVAPASAAERAGLDQGDIIIEYADSPVYSVQRLQWLVASRSTDPAPTLTYLRNGQRTEATLELDQSRQPGAQPSQPPNRGREAYLGVRIQPLTPGLRASFSVPDGQGALVSGVAPQGPADRGGIQPGDVLIRIGKRPLRGVSDVQRVLEQAEIGAILELRVVRGGARRTLEITLGAAPDRRGIQPYRNAPYLGPGYR